jgi:hypothetical protein
MKIKTIITETEAAVPGYQDLQDDESTSYALRQTRLTLKQINKLRKMNDIRQYEKEAKLSSIRAQYGQPAGGEEEPF